VVLEADTDIDDLVVKFSASRAFVQAKLSSKLGPVLNATVAQWVRGYTHGELTEQDAAVLAVADPSRGLRDLSLALDHRRGGVSLSNQQQATLGALRKLLEELLPDGDAADAVLNVAYVAVVDGRKGSADVDGGSARLDGTVVAAGTGDMAFQVLRAQLQHQAAGRGRTSDIDDWRRWLRGAGLPTHADPKGVLAARLQAADAAVTAYRAAIAASADVLPLHALGIPPLSIPGLADGLRAHPQQHGGRTRNRDRSDQLLPLARREGRILLVGQPGAGKTVALQQVAAHFAAVAHAPVPVLISLKQLAKMLPRERSAPLQIHEVVASATPGHDGVLRDALLVRIQEGHAILLLDALDEAHEARDRVVAALGQLLADLPSELDVLLSSRYSAADAATSLGLAYYELETPNDFENTIDALLQHLTPGREAGKQDAWLRRRRDYIKQSRDEEAALWSLPLLATLAVLLLSDRGPDQMPATRATLLHEVIRDSVHRWARHRDDANLPGLDAGTAVGVLVDVFADIASVVAVDGDWAAAVDAVQTRLIHRWGLAAGQAQAAAQGAVEHWDATAGVFISAERQGQLSARTRLFTEIGDALLHTRQDADTGRWVADACDDRDRFETLRLAAGLSPGAAAALADIAVERGGDTLDVACQAWADGAQLTIEKRDRIFRRQLDRLRELSMQRPARKKRSLSALTSAGRASPFVRLAVRLAQLPLTTEQVLALDDACSELAVRQRAVIGAVALANRSSLDAAAPDLDTLDALENALITDEELAALDERPGRRPSAELPHGFDPLIEVALRLLLQQRPGTARRIAQTGYRSTMSAYSRVSTALYEHGLEMALTGVGRPLTEGMQFEHLDQMRKAMDAPFDAARSDLGHAGDLTPSQVWHLDEVAALFDELRLAQETPGEIGYAIERHRAITTSMMRAVAEAAALPLPVIVGQLNQIHAENPDHPQWSLTYRSSARLHVDKLAPSDEHLFLGISAWRTHSSWLAEIALNLFLHARRLTDEQVEPILGEIESWAPWARCEAGVAVAELRPDADLPLHDPMVRAGHAAVATNRLCEEGRGAEVASILSDDDLMVRSNAARHVRNVRPDTVRALEAALRKPAKQWTCPWCDAVRDIGLDRCPEVHHSRPSPKIGG
jgi:hypothetical protein